MEDWLVHQGLDKLVDVFKGKLKLNVLFNFRYFFI